MLRSALCFSIAFLGLSAIASASERVIRVQPGLWEYRHSLSIPGLLEPPEKAMTECIKKEEATRNLSDLLGELSKDGGCSVTNLKDSLNTVKFDLVCEKTLASLSLQSSGHLAFRYGRTKITGVAQGTVSINGVETPVEASGSARRIGRCK